MVSDPLRPIYAQSIISVTHIGEKIVFNQILIYDYKDVSPAHDYQYAIVTNPRFLKEELKALGNNMQKFLDEEENFVNGKRVFPRVEKVLIDFKTESRYPYFTWLIRFEGDISEDGIQVYEARVEPAKLEYDVRSIYLFPLGTKVLEIITSLENENRPSNVIVYRGFKGQRVEEVERISWQVTCIQ
ncbi:MAG: hypothetical protein ACTSWN_09445 [Promethearchaeota archaeon]